MTKDDIMRMARQSGLHLYVNSLTEEPYALVVDRFANLVAAAEREACAKLCEERGMVKGGEVFAARIRARGTT